MGCRFRQARNMSGSMTAIRFLAVLSALALPSTLSAQSGRGSFGGYVELSGPDSDSRRVTVEIVRLGARPERHVVTSDSGDIYHRYSFKDIRMGEYSVKISAPGYVPYETTLLIGSDFQGRLAICLRKKGEAPERRSATMCG